MTTGKRPPMRKFIVRVESSYRTVYGTSSEAALAKLESEYDRKHGIGSFEKLDVAIVEVPR